MFPVTEAYRLPKGDVIGIGFYRGCDDCFAGPGISVYVYPSKRAGKEWLEGAKMEDYKPDEFGGNGGSGISLSFFEVRDLVAAAKEIGTEIRGEDWEMTVEEWLDENGLEMMQKAMRLFEKRIEELRKK
jgi:hypothetical protein